MLGKLSAPVRPAKLDNSRARACCACNVRGCLDIFSLVCLPLFVSPCHQESARYRLKYCLKGALNPKQSTNLLCMAGCCDGAGLTCSAGASY